MCSGEGGLHSNRRHKKRSTFYSIEMVNWTPVKSVTFLLVSILVGCGGGEPKPNSSQGTGGAPPSVVSAIASYDCDTRATPTVQALLSDGLYDAVQTYPANTDGTSPNVPCDSASSVFNLVECTGKAVCFFCLPSNFTCTYSSAGVSSTEICKVPAS